MTNTNGTVFLSHKKADADIAARVHEFIDRCTAGNVDIFNFSDYRSGLKPGSNIREDLADELRSAEVVALVYSRPDDDWSYCMWECGVAVGASQKQKKTILVLQCLEGRKPSIFEGELVVKLWELDSVKAFANMFTEESLFPNMGGPATQLKEHYLEGYAKDLHTDLAQSLKHLRSVSNRVMMQPTVHIETSIPDPTSGESEPTLAMIQADAWSSRELFGWSEAAGTWETIRERLRHQNEDLVRQLVDRAREFRMSRKLPRPLTAPFVADSNVVYDTLLTSMTPLEDEAVGYDLVFLRRDEGYDGGIPADVVDMFAAQPVEGGMEPFNTRVPLLESDEWRLTWYAGAKVLVSDMVKFYFASSRSRYRGQATVTHRFRWDDNMDYYAIEGQASSTGEFIFTYWNLYGGSLLGASALKKTTSGRIYSGHWIGSSGESDISNATMMGGRLRMCTHSKPVRELRQVRADLEADRTPAAVGSASSVDQDIPRRRKEHIDALTEQMLRECQKCVQLEGSLFDST